MGDEKQGPGPGLGDSISTWARARVQECTHCRVCGHSVTPLDRYCAGCGQQDPARVAPSAALPLVLLACLLACGGVTVLLAT